MFGFIQFLAVFLLGIAMADEMLDIDSPVVKLAMEKIREMAGDGRDYLELEEIVSMSTRTEKLPFPPMIVGQIHDLTLRIKDTDTVFDHQITITALQNTSTVTTYRCNYNRERQRYGHVQLPSSQIADPITNRISIVSANTWNYNYWKDRMPLLKQVLGQYGPDLVTFQEVRSRAVTTIQDDRFMIDDLRAMLPSMQYVSEAAMMFADGGDEIVREGLATFSRYPIDSVSVTRLTRDADDPQDFHQRILLDVGIVTPAGVVHVLNTHLSLGEKARARTMPEIHAIVEKHRGQGESVILAGDFNSITADEFFPSMNDAWSITHQSVTSDMGFTWSAWEPDQRIDYIFVTKDLQVQQCHVIGRDQSIRYDVEGHDVLYASDHLFLHAVIETSPTAINSSSSST